MLRICLVAALAIVSMLQFGGTASAENKKVVVTQTLQTLLYLPLYVAKDKGLFTKHGLDVTISVADSPNAAVAAVVAGKAQFSLNGVSSTAIAASKGDPVQIVANCVNGASVWIVGPKDFEYRDLSSLKGQTIITGKLPTTSTALFFKLLRKNGIDPEKDIKTIPVKIGAEVATLLLLPDKAQIAVTYQPGADWAEAMGMKVLVSFPQIYGNYVSSTIAARNDLDPDTVQRFVDAMQEALVLIDKDHATAIEVAKNAFPALAPEIVEAATRRMISDNLFAKSVDIPAEGLKLSIDYQGLQEKVKDLPPYERFVGRAYIDKAIAKQ